MATLSRRACLSSILLVLRDTTKFRLMRMMRPYAIQLRLSMRLLQGTLVISMQDHHWEVSCRLLFIPGIERHRGTQTRPQRALLLLVRHFGDDVELLVPHLNDSSWVSAQIDKPARILCSPR